MNKSEEYGKFPEAKYINDRIKYASPVHGTYKLYVQWKTGEEAVVDFEKTIAENKWFQPLKNPEKFQKIQIASWGSTIEWSEDISCGSDTLRCMADEQHAIFGMRKAG